MLAMFHTLVKLTLLPGADRLNVPCASTLHSRLSRTSYACALNQAVARDTHGNVAGKWG